MKETTKKIVSKRLTKVVALVLMCVICTSGVITVTALSRDVTVLDGDKMYGLTTLNANPDAVLDRLGIEVSPEDSVEFDEAAAKITIKRAFDVTVEVDGKAKTVTMTEGTVADALEASNVALKEGDRVVPFAATSLVPDMEIKVVRGVEVTVEADGKSVKVKVPVTATVEAAVAAADFTVGKDDVLSAEKTDTVSAGMTIKLDRVSYLETETTQEIPYESTQEETGELDLGDTQVKTAGENGARTIVTREKLVNGQVVETEEISSTVVKEPVNEVLLVGTREVETAPSYGAASTSGGVLVDHDGNQIAYTAVYTGSATAYTAPAGSFTATGRPAQYGNVAVNPDLIPYGSRLYICSPDGSYVYGYAVAADTGGALMSGSALVDVYFDTLSECYGFGRRTLSVYILA
ncbi:MAG: ubiquitin-like domain-containing protein [[Clostridium] leptum]